MSVRPALVDCVVLSLQDGCVYYPCCKGCCSRIQVDQQDPKRCRCTKCGYICLRDSVDHRYRLSLRVTRDECIFGVTVFGSCLNPFFGIHAAGLQRLVENPGDPSEKATRSTLLVKAVKDCFIGRHVIFGMKIAESEPEPWRGRSTGSGSRDTKDTVQLIASQMIIPKSLSLGGCTVVSYYQVLLQKVADKDQSKFSGLQEDPLLLLPHRSTVCSINNVSLCTSSLQNQSLQRSQYQDCTLTPTPPWQQSLGLVTSSAEQEEGCSTQDSTEDDIMDKNRTPKHIYKANPGYCMAVESRRLSCQTPFHSSSCSSRVFTKNLNSSVDKVVGSASIPVAHFSPAPPDHYNSKMKCSSTDHLSDSLCWENLPFSESLSEFLSEENKCLMISNVSEQNQKKSTKEVRPQSKNSSVEMCASQNYAVIKDIPSQLFEGIKDTAAPTRVARLDLSEQICEKLVGCGRTSQAETLVSQDEEAHSVSFEDDEEQLEGSTYNCSADLFSSSPTFTINTNTPSMHKETVSTSSDANKNQHTSGGNLNVSHLTPHQQKLRSSECIIDDYLVSTGNQDLDFIPPSQSTPIVKVTAGTRLFSKRMIPFGDSQTHHPDSCSNKKCLPKLNDGRTPKMCSACKRKRASGKQLSQFQESTKENLWIRTSSRHQRSSKKRFWKPRKHLLAQQFPGVPKEATNSGSPRQCSFTCDQSCDMTVCDNDEILVPPTPTAKSSQSVRLKTQRQSESCFSKTICTEEQQEDRVKAEIQTRNFDRETYEKDMCNVSNCYLQDGENEACDWSKDLFSDSV